MKRKFEMYARRTMSPLPLHQRLPTLSPRHVRRTSAVPKNLVAAPKRVRLEQFRLMRTIGTGTFARVRLARRKGSEEVVVIKSMKKSLIIQKRQVEHVKNEKTILTELRHPFIVQLISSFQDSKNLYLVMEYIPGGELYSHLRAQRKLNVEGTRFYAAEVASVFAFLHSHHIMYRDLKPENVLINRNGHLKLVDFGFVKKLKDGERSYTLCGTPEYLPPEIVTQTGHSFSADWWTLGIFIFEMSVGRPPFVDKNPYNIYKKIIENQQEFPDGFRADLRSLINGLLDKDSATRFSAEEVHTHAFFQSLNWKEVEQLALQPPFIPKLKGSDDSSYFDTYKEEADQDFGIPQKATGMELFIGF